jgi:hypothetical protein
MIFMQNPSFVFNSVDVPWPTYKMWATEDGDVGTTIDDLIGIIAEANRSAWEQKQTSLRNIIINSHGLEGGGKISIGGKGKDGIDNANASKFSFLRNNRHLTGTIWIVACQAAAGSAGKLLCSNIAQASGYQVVASEDDQDTGIWGGYRVVVGRSGQIDEFEGTVYSFYAGGGSRVIDPHEDIYTIME